MILLDKLVGRVDNTVRRIVPQRVHPRLGWAVIASTVVVQMRDTSLVKPRENKLIRNGPRVREIRKSSIRDVWAGTPNS